MRKFNPGNPPGGTGRVTFLLVFLRNTYKYVVEDKPGYPLSPATTNLAGTQRSFAGTITLEAF